METDVSCIICHQEITNFREVVKIQAKGSDGINEASRARGDNIRSKPGDCVHISCRKTYTNQLVIKGILADRSKTNNKNTENTPLLRSQGVFSFSENCLFCTKPAKVNGKKRDIDVYPVRTSDFQTEVLLKCKQRDDEWAAEVRGRLESVNDLVAADAVYHNPCSVSFRTNRTIPQAFTPDKKQKSKVGRPKKEKGKAGRPSTTSAHFLQIVDYLMENEDEQLTISDLVAKMTQICGENAYSPTYMKKMLLNHFKEDIIVSDMTGKCDVITLRRTAKSILREFYTTPRNNSDAEKQAVIEAAAQLIKNDIKSIPASKEYYPATSDIMSPEKNLEHVTDSLRTFLKILFSAKDSDLKVSSIGQAIMQAVRPRGLLPPLQIGLGIQLNHHFGSRFLIDVCHALGFCASYNEVNKFASSSAVSQSDIIQGLQQNNSLQFVADNVDHNSCTLDGHDTFHGMGIIASVTPGSYTDTPIRRMTVSADDLRNLGKIDVYHYRQPTNIMSTMQYQTLEHFTEKEYPMEKFDQLTGILRPLKSPLPSWSGLMNMVMKGTYPGKSNITFLPMIDLNPNDMTCIYSTLQYTSKLARQFNRTPVITFDQPLYWKAFTIICNENEESSLKSIVLRLGGFHLEMSYLGAIGNIMKGSGLQEVLERVYAPNAVVRMLSGKAVARAVRGHLLVDTAVHAMLASKIYAFPVETDHRYNDGGEDKENNNQEATTFEIENAELKETSFLFDRFVNSEISFDCLMQNENVDTILHQVKEETEKLLETKRTASLWIQYSRMIQVLRNYIAAERTGSWEQHLKCIKDMLPYLAAAGHNLYTKSAYVYLTEMQSLEKNNPDVYNNFISGHHVLRRTHKYWGGLSTDLVIEQELMRSMKTSGGLTRGRGLGEVQRVQWLLSMPHHAAINNAMQQVTGVGYSTSEQHKDASSTRKVRDNKDIKIITEYMDERNPFNGDDPSLKNIETGQVAENCVNQDKAKEIGENIIQLMPAQHILEYSFKRGNMRTMGTNSHVQVDGETVDIDPQLLFQRLTIASRNIVDDPAELFRFELSCRPPSLFDSSGLPRQAQKSILADTIWSLGNCGVDKLPEVVLTVLDGGSLLQRMAWKIGESFASICEMYTTYVTKKYTRPIVVFDGYGNGMSTKDVTHVRRGKGLSSTKIQFTGITPCKTKKELFLANQDNKQKFLSFLGDKMQEAGCTVIHSAGDADLLIVKTALNYAQLQNVEVIGEDTDLLVLLCYYFDRQAANNIFLRSDCRKTGGKAIKIWDIRATADILSESICSALPGFHSVTGCDTTSRLFGIGKGQALKKLISNQTMIEQASQLMSRSLTSDEVVNIGESIIVTLYGGQSGESLDNLRYRKFTAKVSAGIANSCVQVQSLPPTSDAARFHSLRVYHQCQSWLENEMDPKEWGWRVTQGRLVPIKSKLPPAPDQLLKVIRCSCKTNCENKRCSCRKNGLDCSTACTECKGINCANSSSVTEADLTEDA